MQYDIGDSAAVIAGRTIEVRAKAAAPHGTGALFLAASPPRQRLRPDLGRPWEHGTLPGQRARHVLDDVAEIIAAGLPVERARAVSQQPADHRHALPPERAGRG